MRAIGAALETVGATIDDVDSFAYTWDARPGKLARIFVRHPFRVSLRHWPAMVLAGNRVARDLMSGRRAGRALARALDDPRIAVRTRGVPHHRTHAACAYYTSGFSSGAVLTVDGQGERQRDPR